VKETRRSLTRKKKEYVRAAPSERTRDAAKAIAQFEPSLKTDTPCSQLREKNPD
jgi:hypothetical protein